MHGEVGAGEQEQPDRRHDDRDDDVARRCLLRDDHLDQRREHDEQTGDERRLRGRRALDAEVLHPVADERDDTEGEGRDDERTRRRGHAGPPRAA